MSRTRPRRSASSSRRDAGEEVTILDELAFQPAAVCGGRLSTSDYNLRSRKCTEDQLERLKATAEFKAWEREHGAGASPSWAARLEQAKALLPPSLIPYSKPIAIVSIITLLLIVPMLFPLAMRSGSSGIATPATAPASAAQVKEKIGSSPSVRAPVPAPVAPSTQQKKIEDTLKKQPSNNPETAGKNEDSVQQQQQLLRKERELAEAKQTAAAAQEQQRQLITKLDEVTKRETALIEETKRLSAALTSKKTSNNNFKSNLHKAFTISGGGGGGRGDALKPPFLTGKSPRALLHYASYYAASLGPDVALLTIEIGLLLLAAGLMLGLQKSQKAAEQMKKEYLVAYKRQIALFAKAEEVYEGAYAVQSGAEKMAIEASSSKSREVEAGAAASAAAAAAATAAAEELAKATAQKEKDLQAKEQQLEKRVEEIKTSAAAQTSAWAAAATQLLQLASSSPSKNNNASKNQAQKSRLSKSSSSTPPSPGTVVNAITDKYSQLRVRLTSAEAAATDAATVADAARRDREHSEQRVSEMITDNELLKERLSDTKKALAVALDAKAAAELHEAEVRAALETAQQNLATVQAEKEELMKEVDTLKESLKTASDKVAAVVKEGDHLEAQVDQLTVSLGDESAQKQRAEQRCTQLEGDLSALQILADGLQNQVISLEHSLEESLAAQTELKFASEQLEAAHAAAVAAASAPNPTPALVQRALNEESAALQHLTSAERRAAQASSVTSYTLRGGEDIAPRPALPHGYATSTTNGSYPPHSPQQINSARASSLIARAGKIASMLSEGMDGLLGGDTASVTTSTYSTKSGAVNGNFGALSSRGRLENGVNQQHALYSARRRSVDSAESGSLTARMARASELFTAAEEYLGQELPPLSSLSTSDGGNRPYRDIPFLLEGGDARVNITVNGNKESSAAGGGSTEENLARMTSVVNNNLKDAEVKYSDLMALDTHASRTTADHLSSLQVKIVAAVHEVESTTKLSDNKREKLAHLAEIAREKQHELENAQLAVSAAIEEEKNNSESAGVAAAAEHLQAAETAQNAASEAVYQAERDMYAAVSAQLKANEVLRREQNELFEAFEVATDLLQNGKKVKDAKSVSPRKPIGLGIVSKDVFD